MIHTHTNRSRRLIFTAPIACCSILLLAPVVLAQAEGCFQLVFDFQCGQDDCGMITCQDQTSGPLCTRERWDSYKCGIAAGQGLTSCDEVRTVVQLWQQNYTCFSTSPPNTYVPNGDPFVYDTCTTAGTYGDNCGGPST